MKLLTDEEAAKMVNEEELQTQALASVEQHGIVFLDELDKVARARNAGRGRLPRGRAARPAAAGRRLHRQHQVRHGQDRPHPVHRLRRIPRVQALGPDSRAAGPVPDPRRAEVADDGGLRAHPDRARRLADTQYAALLATEEVELEFAETASGASPRSPVRSTRTPRTSAPGACTR